MNRLSATLLTTVLLAAAAFAQMSPPKPGPEHEKLNYFVGDWVSEGTMKPGPFGPGGAMSTTETSKWMDGGFFVQIQSDFKSATMGNGSGIAFMGYDPEAKVYTYDEFNSFGEATHARGTAAGDTWTWTSDMKMGPQTLKTRFTQKILSPTSYTFKFETSPDGDKWDTAMEGKAIKR
jgi:hypothetical protein